MHNYDEVQAPHHLFTSQVYSDVPNTDSEHLNIALLPFTSFDFTTQRSYLKPRRTIVNNFPPVERFLPDRSHSKEHKVRHHLSSLKGIP